MPEFTSELTSEPASNFIDWLPFPKKDAHKYSRGKAVLIGGSAAYPGAVCLCALATQYCGAGYTEVFTDKSNKTLVQGFRPSLVVRSFEELTIEKVLTLKNPGACIFGPGVDMNDSQIRPLLIKAITSVDKPLLIDGGALSFVADAEIRNLLLERQNAGFVTVLTPHGGEAAKLASVIDAQNLEQEALSKALAQEYGATVVLKNSTTVISGATWNYVFDKGTPALAKAGTGDVLAGIIGGFLAQGLPPQKATILGVNLHSLSAYEAIKTCSIISVCAEEVVNAIPAVLKNLEEMR